MKDLPEGARRRMRTRRSSHCQPPRLQPPSPTGSHLGDAWEIHIGGEMHAPATTVSDGRRGRTERGAPLHIGPEASDAAVAPLDPFEVVQDGTHRVEPEHRFASTRLGDAWEIHRECRCMHLDGTHRVEPEQRIDEVACTFSRTKTHALRNLSSASTRLRATTLRGPGSHHTPLPGA